MNTSNQSPEDAARLLELARAGDVEAFASLFESFREMVFRVACRLVGEGDAEDVVMDVYLKAWQSLPRFQGWASVKTWLYRIAYTVSVDCLRARHRQTQRFVRESELELDHPLEVADAAQKSAVEEVQSAETAGLVRRALDRLPPEHRTALLMRFADDMSYAEIAAATGVSIGTVMSRLFYGKRKLQSALRELGPGRKGERHDEVA